MLSPGDSWWTMGNEACVPSLEHNPRPPLCAGLCVGSMSTGSLKKSSGWPFADYRCAQGGSSHCAMRRTTTEICWLRGNTVSLPLWWLDGHVRSKTSWGLWRGWSVQWRQRELSTWALQLWKQNAIEQNAVENRVSSKLLGTLLQSTGAWYSNISEWQVASSVLKGFGRNTKVHVTVFLFPGVNYCLHNSLSVNCINCSSE